MASRSSSGIALAVLMGLSGAAVAEEAVWHEHPNHMSVILGQTEEDEHDGFTFGIDYEHRISDFLGLGAVLERAGGDIDATTLLGVADLHFGHRWIVQTGPGLERLEGHDGHGSETEFVYRLGVIYEVEFERFTLAPQIHYDATSGEDAIVFALALGYSY